MADLEDVFEKLRHRVRSESKLELISQIETFFEDQSETIEETLRDRARQYVSISFDRRKNDKNFSYQFADFLLRALDMAHDGQGLRKPVNQLRVIRWQNTRTSLKNLLLAAKATFTDPTKPAAPYLLRFRGILLLTYKPVGDGLDPSFMDV